LTFVFRFFTVAASMGLAACSTRDNREAKRRVFSPEPQPTVAQKLASEKIDAAALGKDPDHVRRVVRMDAGEATERLGPFRYQATVAFDWTMGNETERLTEEHLLVSGKHGDFHARIINDQEQGMELIRFADTVYGRSRARELLKGAAGYRVRRLDRGHADETRDEAFGALRTFYDMINGRLGLGSPTETENLSRPAKRYSVSLSDKALPEPEPDLPPIQYPKEGATEGTRRRLQFTDHRQPRSVSGEIWFDADTGVPVKSDLTAEITAPGEKGQEAHLVLNVKTAIVALGDSVTVTPPKNPLPDETRPSGVAAALARFGLSGGPDGGMKMPEPPEAEEE
jgi:hypothetical protein